MHCQYFTSESEIGGILSEGFIPSFTGKYQLILCDKLHCRIISGDPDSIAIFTGSLTLMTSTYKDNGHCAQVNKTCPFHGHFGMESVTDP